MLTAQLLEQGLYANVDLTTKVTLLFSATSTHVNKVLVVKMLTVLQLDKGLFVGVEVDMLEIHFPNAD